MTVYHDDNDKRRKQDFEEFDGLGHFRRVTSSGDFFGSETRTVTTTYNGTKTLVINPDDSSPGAGNDFELPERSAPWVLNTYTQRTVSHGGDTATREFCFDTNTGFLERARTWRGASRSGQDVLVDFEEGSGGTGRVALERSYGGDLGGLGTQDVCDVPLTTSNATTQVVHRYASGVLETSEYVDCNQAALLRVADFTIDPNTGMVSQSRDSAGVATSYSYDRLGRRTEERPAGGA